MSCRLLKTVASFKGQKLYLLKYHLLKKICLLKGCAISNLYLARCSRCCSFPLIPFRYKAHSSGAVQSVGLITI